MQAVLNKKSIINEYYVNDVIKKQGVTVEIETDCITYNAESMILSWQCWSEFLNDWIDIDLDMVQKKWPSKFLKMQNIIDEIVHMHKIESLGEP